MVNPIRKLIVSESFTQLEIASGTRTYAPSHTILIYLFSDIALVVKRKKKKATNVDSFKAKANISDVAVVPLPDAGGTYIYQYQYIYNLFTITLFYLFTKNIYSLFILLYRNHKHFPTYC